jgi:hypothetical protein
MPLWYYRIDFTEIKVVGQAIANCEKNFIILGAYFATQKLPGRRAGYGKISRSNVRKIREKVSPKKGT